MNGGRVVVAWLRTHEKRRIDSKQMENMFLYSLNDYSKNRTAASVESVERRM